LQNGTLYQNCLILGANAPWYPLVRSLVQAFAFTEQKGTAWLGQNVEEVGKLENFHPQLYHHETGRTALIGSGIKEEPL